MSGKIRSKDLAYEAALPPFLQRLRNQNAGRGDADRHERPAPRVKLAKDANDDDGPTVVDETGETMTQKDFEKRAAETVGGTTQDKTTSNHVEAEASDKAPSKRVDQHVTSGTTSKKRKAAKVIADDAAHTSADVSSVKKTKKKSKPIKLAFDNNDDDG